MSYLATTYLDGYDDTTDLAGPTVAASPAPGEAGPPAVRQPDTITLPGGIVMPKMTFYVICAALAALALYLYLKRKKG